MDMNTNFLKIPLYKLNYIDDIEKFNGLNLNEFQSLSVEYDNDELSSILNALDWAVKNPNFNFSSLIPETKYTNSQIFQFLSKMNQSIKAFQN